MRNLNHLDPSGTRISTSSEFSVVNSAEIALYHTKHTFLPECDYMTFRYLLLQIRRLSVLNVRAPY